MHPAEAAWGPIAPLDLVRLRAAVAGPAAAAGPAAGVGLGAAAGSGATAGLRAAAGSGAMWTDIRVVAETASTNQDVLKLAGDGASEGLVIAAESQTAGRGRQGRSWQTRPAAALTFSVLLRPQSVPHAARGWVPLLAGVATARALRRVAAVDARLKWPNDVLLGGGKLAGILAEQSGDAIVVGIGINVLGRDHDLPTATATSLERGGAGLTDRTELLAEILRQLEHWYLRWRETASGDADESGLRQEYLSLCATLGRLVRVQLPGDQMLTGTAVDVDGAGQLLIRRDGGDVVAVTAGDVIHVR
jgi:BirA family transcriptional regulator, biotin operon repressor / biotin---[acetyl-CoA-carboxylase] ligase